MGGEELILAAKNILVPCWDLIATMLTGEK
jgi:hypothetical protein